MAPYAQSLMAAGSLKFTPHYMLWSCPEEFLNTTQCQTECILNGTYCSPDPDDDPKQGYSGRDVLMVRRACTLHAGLPPHQPACRPVACVTV